MIDNQSIINETELEHTPIIDEINDCVTPKETHQSIKNKKKQQDNIKKEQQKYDTLIKKIPSFGSFKNILNVIF